MKVTIPRRARIALYLLNILGTPVVVYARAKGWIGDLEMALWGAEVSAAMTMAGLNVGTDQQAVTVRLNAEQVADVEQGRTWSDAIEAYRRNGGRGGVL